MTLEELLSQYLEDASRDPLVDVAKDVSSGVMEALDKPNYPNFGGEPTGPRPTVRSLLGSIGEVAAEMSPGLGDLLSAQDAVQEAQDGNYGWSALSAMGALPMIPQLGVFAGKTAKTANRKLLNRARHLEKKGVDAKAIHNETGWFKAPWDEQWRFEIPDHSFSTDGITDNINKSTKGLRTEGFKHEALADAYPTLDQMTIEARQAIPGSRVGGEYVPSTPMGTGRSQRKIKMYPQSDKQANRVGVHELQHAIQELENFSRGGNDEAIQKLFPNISREEVIDIYKRTAGETEARLAERRSISPFQNSTFPLDDLDTPIERILNNPDDNYQTLFKYLKGN